MVMVEYYNKIDTKAKQIKALISEQEDQTVAGLIKTGIFSKEKVLLMAQLSIQKIDNEFGIHETTVFGSRYGEYELCVKDAIKIVLERRPKDLAWLMLFDNNAEEYSVKRNFAPVSMIYRKGRENRGAALEELERDIIWFLASDTMQDTGFITKAFEEAGC